MIRLFEDVRCGVKAGAAEPFVNMSGTLARDLGLNRIHYEAVVTADRVWAPGILELPRRWAAR